MEDVERIGLDHQVGTAGRLLSPQERASVNLVRCLVKRPDILVVDGALAPFDDARARNLLALLIELTGERSLFFVLPNEQGAERFDLVMRFNNGQVTTEVRSGSVPSQPTAPKRVAGVVA